MAQRSTYGLLPMPQPKGDAMSTLADIFRMAEGLQAMRQARVKQERETAEYNQKRVDEDAFNRVFTPGWKATPQAGMAVRNRDPLFEGPVQAAPGDPVYSPPGWATPPSAPTYDARTGRPVQPAPSAPTYDTRSVSMLEAITTLPVRQQAAALAHAKTLRTAQREEVLPSIIAQAKRIRVNGVEIVDPVALQKDMETAGYGDAFPEVAKEVGDLNDRFLAFGKARTEVVQRGADAVRRAGNDPLLGKGLVDMMAANEILTAEQAQQIKDRIDQDPAFVAALTAQYGSPEKTERGAPGSQALDPAGRPIPGTQVPALPKEPTEPTPGSFAEFSTATDARKKEILEAWRAEANAKRAPEKAEKPEAIPWVVQDWLAKIAMIPGQTWKNARVEVEKSVPALRVSFPGLDTLKMFDALRDLFRGDPSQLSDRERIFQDAVTRTAGGGTSSSTGKGIPTVPRGDIELSPPPPTGMGPRPATTPATKPPTPPVSLRSPSWPPANPKGIHLRLPDGRVMEFETKAKLDEFLKRTNSSLQ